MGVIGEMWATRDPSLGISRSWILLAAIVTMEGDFLASSLLQVSGLLLLMILNETCV